MLGIEAISDYDVQVPLGEVAKNTLHGIYQDDELTAKLLELKEANGGSLDLVFYYKFGSDGSQGHPVFKQVLDDERYQGACYASGFIAIQCVAKLQNGQVAILYNNNLVNSSLSWRPLRLLFQKESIALIKEEKERLDRQRNELESEEYELFEGITVKFRGYYTMCDMKGCV